MPLELIRKMKAGYADSDLSETEINHRVYGHLNKIGALEDRKSGGTKARLEKAVKRARSEERARKYLKKKEF